MNRIIDCKRPLMIAVIVLVHIHYWLYIYVVLILRPLAHTKRESE